MSLARQLVSQDRSRPTVAGVQAAQPLYAYELSRCLEEVRIIGRPVVRHFRQPGAASPHCPCTALAVVKPAQINRKPVQVTVMHGLHTSQQLIGQRAMKALDERVLR
jgi:hypothetical protein